MQRLCTVPYKLYHPPNTPKFSPEISNQLANLHKNNVTE